MSRDISDLMYWTEVEEVAESLLKEVLDDYPDETDESTLRNHLEERLWETIDGHEWIIYTAYNYDVLKHSPNSGYSVDNFGTDVVIDGELNISMLAFGALFADVNDRLWEKFDESECEDCLGDGVCSECGGEETVILGEEEETTCRSCDGSGKCAACKGRGRILP